MIDTNSIETLKNTLDIVDVVGNYIELKKAGANYKACCPFHGEKTASLVVSPAKQIYHCFGCGAGGDAIKFVMELEKLSYPEAIEKLASSVNFALSYTKSGNSDYSDSKRVLESLESWYKVSLDNNQVATKYLHDRGVSQNSIERFGIGYTPSGGEVLSRLNALSLPMPQCVESGAVATGEDGRYYARLVERITFPIYSSAGAIVGFGGRTISNHPAKYINSPQTKLFNKSRLLYGYSQAKDSIYKNKQIIICEGYLDVVMLHQGGFTEAVATMGTALTSEHLPLLRKGEPKIILAYDGDKAGVAAALKGAVMLSKASFDGGVVLFPDGQDPADMISKNQSGAVAVLFRNTKPFIPFVIEQIASQYDLRNPKAKEDAFNEVRSYMSGLSEIMRESYFSVAATTLGLSIGIFTKGSRSNAKISNSNDTKYDIEQLSLLRTMMEYPQLNDDVLNFITAEMMGEYNYHFNTIVREEWSDITLVELSLNEHAKVMSESDMWRSVQNLQIRHYSNMLDKINNNNTVSIAVKIKLIRKLKMEIIPKLKRGEKVFYDSTITI